MLPQVRLRCRLERWHPVECQAHPVERWHPVECPAHPLEQWLPPAEQWFPLAELPAHPPERQVRLR